MVIGDPYKFSIIFDRVDKWNMSINDNNGYLNLSIDSEIFPKKLINTIVNTSLFDIKNSLNNIPVDTSIYNMNTSEAFKTLYNLVYPVEFENDNDYRYELSPMALTDENAFVFAVKGKGKVKIVASILEYDYENSRYIFNDKVIEVILEQDEIAEIVNNIDDIINGYIEPETSVYKGYKQDKIEMRGDRAEMSDFPLYLNTVAGGLDRRNQTIGGFSFVVKIYAVPVV